MNKKILGIIFITAFIIIWGTKFLFVPSQNEHHEDHANHSDHAGHDDNHGEHEEHGEITLAILEEFGAEVGTVSSGILEETIQLPGEIQIDPDRLAHITPRFDGLVKAVFKNIGESVKKDELLAVVESNESLTAYEIRSSIDGIIIDRHLTKGETAQTTEHYFAVANLSEVWVNLNVFQKYLSELEIGQSVALLINLQAPMVLGKISFISPTIDEHTRTATARVILKNPSGHFRPGQFVTGVVTLVKTHIKMILPKTAIENIGGLPIVFAQDEYGFEPMNIRIGRENQQSVEILSGLNPGQKYIKKGGFILKAQLAKSSFSDGHNH